MGCDCPVVSEFGKQINLIMIVLASTGKSLRIYIYIIELDKTQIARYTNRNMAKQLAGCP